MLTTIVIEADQDSTQRLLSCLGLYRNSEIVAIGNPDGPRRYDGIHVCCVRHAAGDLGAEHYALRMLAPLVEDDYFPDCCTPEYRAAVAAMRSALGDPTPATQRHPNANQEPRP